MLPNDFEEDEAELRLIEEEEDDESPFAHLTPLAFQTSARRIRDLQSDYAARDLDPRPTFQRGYVWDLRKASKLVESVLLNVPLPIVYTAEEANGTELVIDGQQRLLTFFGFIEGRFPKGESRFKLRGLKILADLNGKEFSDLEETAKNNFLKYNVTVVKIDKSSHADVKFEIFERLNSGSVSLSAQELRNCIYRGPLNDLLRDLAENKNFLGAMGLKKPLDRMKDVEMVLRFAAFQHATYLQYPGRMKSFLNGFMEESKSLSPAKGKEIRARFEKAAEMAYTVFGDKAFRRYRLGSKSSPGGWEPAMNLAVYDAVMWAFSRFEKRQIVPAKDAIRSKLIELMTDDADFHESVTLATADQPKVEYRMKAFENAVKSAIDLDEPKARLFTFAFKKSLYDTSPICQICGQKIESLDDAQVDHISEYHKGGKTVPENGRLVHRFCNKARSRA
jgi:hypothetical protein